MQPIPGEVWASFERRLDEAGVAEPQRPDYRKWVRFYLDFCHKYGHSAASPASPGPFLSKLAARNQRIGLQVVRLERCERAVLEELPIAAPAGFDGLSAVGDHAPAPRTIVRLVRQNAAVVRGGNDQRIGGQTGAVERVEHFADTGIQVLDQGRNLDEACDVYKLQPEPWDGLDGAAPHPSPLPIRWGEGETGSRWRAAHGTARLVRGWLRERREAGGERGGAES